MTWNTDGLGAERRILYESSLCWVGEFRCAVSHPEFTTLGSPSFGPLIAIPRYPVKIRQSGSASFIADSCAAVLHSLGVEYDRAPLTGSGDWCVVIHYKPRVFEDGIPPALIGRGWSGRAHLDSAAHMSQWLVRERLLDPPRCRDEFAIDSQMIHIAVSLFERTSESSSQCHARAGTKHRHRELAEAVREQLAREPEAPHTLSDLASMLHCSPFHLSRVFVGATGASIHQHLIILRVRLALHLMCDPSRSVTEVALASGFSSHSHFTDTFRSFFGMPPSEARRLASRSTWQEMSTILEAVRRINA